jgi:S1-C subfamily serine protease
MKNHLLFIFRYIVIGLALGFVYMMVFGHFKTSSNQNPAHAVFSYAPAINKINQSVVSIYTQSIELSTSNNIGISPRSPYQTKNYLGSGVIVSSRGHIVTNKHVIAGASRILVYLWNNQAFEASFVGQDTLTDLAVIKIDGIEFIPAEFADSELVNTGDVVLAIGNPFGLNQSASLGIVSATGRKGLTENGLENFIQTDAAINQGNSGGALVNPLGQVVGISTASYNQIGAEGINFAIPSNYTVQIINSIIDHGEVLRGWLGLSFITENGYVIFQIPKPKFGIIVSGVLENSPAYLAEIKPKDIITHINDKAVNSYEEYRQLLLSQTVGEKVKVNGYNENGSYEKLITIAPPPQSLL